jgi:3-oxoacyl-[acyl-carrier protein] reductase
MKEADWDDVLDTNLKGAFNCIKAVSKTMIKQRSGRIINVASIVGVSGNPGQANYVASKAGIIGLAKAVAKELAPRNITVNVVAPGFIETDMTASFDDKVKEMMISQIPLGRAGTSEDIAAVVKFLASDDASYITGQVIHVSGGMYM